MRRMAAIVFAFFALLAAAPAHASDILDPGGCGTTPENKMRFGIESNRAAEIAADDYVEARIVFVGFPNHATTLPTWADTMATQMHDYIATMSRGAQNFHVSVLRRTDVPGDAWVADSIATYYANGPGFGACNTEIMNKIAAQQSGVWTGVECVIMVHYQCTFSCGSTNEASCDYNCPWGGIATLNNGSVPGFTGYGETQRMYFPLVNEAYNREIQFQFAAHEYGHLLGFIHAPGSDYATPYFNNVGRYDVERSGNYGSFFRDEGMLPWSALEMASIGWVPVDTIATDTRNLHIPDMRSAGAKAIKVVIPGSHPPQCFVLENRRNSNPYDAKLRNSGLIAWHILDYDDYFQDANFWDVESAVGRFTSGVADPVSGKDSLELVATYAGSGNDFFDGVTKTAFSRTTNPNTNAYSSALQTSAQSVLTSIGFENIRRDSLSNDMIVDVYVSPKQYVTAPNGGETIERGSATNITWATRPLAAITNVDLYFSTNGGGSWNLIQSGVSNTGTYSWTPAVTGSQFRVRVVSHDSAGGTGTDDSDANFLVTESGHWVTLGSLTGARKQPAVAFDTARQRVMLFGGSDGTSNMNDVWAMSKEGTWSQVTTSGTAPSARRAANMIYDVSRDRLIVFGGFSSQSLFSQLNDLWKLDLSNNTWTQLSPGGTPPTVFYSTQAVYDPTRDRLDVIEGTGPVYTWPLAGGSWSVLTYSGLGGTTAGYDYFSAAYDSLGDALTVFGGWIDGPNPATDNLQGVATLSLAGAGPYSWSNGVATGGPPARRSLAAMIYEPIRDRGVMFGGEEFGTGSNPHYNDTWELSLSGSPHWWQMSPAGSAPSVRSGIGSAYDRNYDRMVITCGTNGSTNYASTYALSWDEIGPSQITDLNPAVYCTRIDFTFTNPGDDGTVGQAVEWELRRSASTITDANWGSASVVASGTCGAPGTQQGPISLEMGLCATRYYYAVKARDDGYTWSPVSNVTSKVGTPCPSHGIQCYDEGPVAQLPRAMELSLAGANPAQGPVDIAFGIPATSLGETYQVAVFDLAGRRVKTLDRGVAKPGRTAVTWDRTSDEGARVAAGVYYVRFQLGGKVMTKNVVALR